MGVKSTRTLTRREAESRYVYLRSEEMERELRAEAVRLDNHELARELEHLNDKSRGGEGFENYTIRG